MADSGYDMRQKLLFLQTELLKDADKPEHPTKVVPQAQPQRNTHETHDEPNIKDIDSVTLLKAILSTQQKIYGLLVEMNNKLK